MGSVFKFLLYSLSLLPPTVCCLFALDLIQANLFIHLLVSLNIRTDCSCPWNMLSFTGLATDADPQALTQPIPHPIEHSIHLSCSFTATAHPFLVFPVCLSCSVYLSTAALSCASHPTTPQLLQQCCSCVTTHGALVSSACFPGCMHLCTYIRGGLLLPFFYFIEVSLVLFTLHSFLSTPIHLFLT